MKALMSCKDHHEGSQFWIALRMVSVTFAIFLCAIFLVVPAKAAFASYENPSVSTVAQVRTDGALHVVEQRAFEFDSRYSVIFWPISHSSEDQEVDVQSVHLIRSDDSGNFVRSEIGFSEVPFQISWRNLLSETDGSTKSLDDLVDQAANAKSSSESYLAPISANTFALDARQSMVYLFLEPTSDALTIECDYVISDAATLFDDTSELYWDYACVWPDVDSKNLSAQIQLPVPEGDSVEPGVNVLAWGHGPDGSMTIGIDGTVHFEVPDVRAGLSAYAHVLFPKSWLSNVSVLKKLNSTGIRFDAAVAEEKSWIDAGSGWWLNRYAMEILLLSVAIVALIVALVLYWAFGRKPESSTTLDNGVNDIDSSIIARLMRWNHWSIEDLGASIRGITETGAIKVYEDAENIDLSRFILMPKSKTIELSGIQQQTMHMLFDDFGQGYESVSIAEIERTCKTSPSVVKSWLEAWQRYLTSQVDEAGLFDKKSFTASRWCWGLAVLVLILALVELFGIGSFWPGLLMCLVAAAIAFLAYYMPSLTELGAEIFNAHLGDAQDVGEQGLAQEAAMPEWENRIDEVLSGLLLPKPVKKARGKHHKRNADDHRDPR